MHFYNWQSYLFIIVFSFLSNYYYFFNFHRIAFLPGVVAFTAYWFPRLMTSRFSMSGWERLQVLIIRLRKIAGNNYYSFKTLRNIRLQTLFASFVRWKYNFVQLPYETSCLSPVCSSDGHSFVKVKSLVHRNIPLLNVA